MHCRTCGKSVLEQAVVCVSCGVPPLLGKQFCQECGAETNPAATVCIKCGVPLKSSSPTRSRSRHPVPDSASTDVDLVVASDPPKDPLLMALLSGCCLAFLGQLILGQKTKGIVMMIVSAFICVLTLGVGILILYPVAAIDAYLIAKKLKNGQAVGQWEFF